VSETKTSNIYSVKNRNYIKSNVTMNHDRKHNQHRRKNVANTKKRQSWNAVNINITQVMVGKQQVKRWGVYRWAG